MIRFQSAAEAAEWLQGSRYPSRKNGLSNMLALTALLGHPERSLRCVHVAGTNGKGSVCALIERALRACGKRTGLYTSPYLTRYNDRMRVDGAAMPDGDLIRLASVVAEAAEALVEREIFPNAFELGTALAFLWFRERKVDYAVIEVGVGGRLDATNVLTPAACAIAAIGLDHTKTLGDTLPQIAFEKAGIIKPGAPCAVTRQREAVMRVFREAAARVNAPLVEVSPPEILAEDAYGSRFRCGGTELQIRLPGAYQAENAALSHAVLRILQSRDAAITDEGIREGFLTARWPARLTWLGGVLIDGAHNPQGAATLAAYVKRYFGERPRALVTAMMRDKDYPACARVLAGAFDHVICCEIDYARCAGAHELAAAYAEAGVRAEAIPKLAEALEAARRLAGADGVVAVAGSLYLAGDAISLIDPSLGQQI